MKITRKGIISATRCLSLQSIGLLSSIASNLIFQFGIKSLLFNLLVFTLAWLVNLFFLGCWKLSVILDTIIPNDE